MLGGVSYNRNRRKFSFKGTVARAIIKDGVFGQGFSCMISLVYTTCGRLNTISLRTLVGGSDGFKPFTLWTSRDSRGREVLSLLQRMSQGGINLYTLAESKS